LVWKNLKFFFHSLTIRRDRKSFQKLLDRKPFQKRIERKPLATFEFEKLIPKPYRRDQPAQRLRLSLKNLSPNPIGVINRRKGCV
jgi:hypothetical protein